MKVGGRFTYAKVLSCAHDVKLISDEWTIKTVPRDESEKRLRSLRLEALDMSRTLGPLPIMGGPINYNLHHKTTC